MLAADVVLLIGSISVIFVIFALIGAVEIAGEVLLIGFTKFAPPNIDPPLPKSNRLLSLVALVMGGVVVNDDDGGLLAVDLAAPPKIDNGGGAATGDTGDEIIGGAKVLAGSVDFSGVD